MITSMGIRKHEWLGESSSDISDSDPIGCGSSHAAVRRSPACSAYHYRSCCHSGELTRGTRARLYCKRCCSEHLAGWNRGHILLGGWQAPFGIVLVLDRLSALMLVLNAVLALTSLIYALARWRKAGPHFQSLFQFLIMGVNGAFLTGDLFNLFVFVEVLLAASYGLLLHGLGEPRVKAGLHYIAINLAGSSVFLIGVSLIYGVTGTLNMADVAARASLLTEDERILFETGIAILGSAFLLKAGAWPLNFWLPSAYGTACAPSGSGFFDYDQGGDLRAAAAGIAAVRRFGGECPGAIQ